MKTIRTLIPLCAAWLVLTPLHADSVSEQPRENTDSSPQATTQPDTDAAFDLSFPGGSFDDLLEAIANETGRPPNAIVGENARQRPLPPFDLHSVTVDEVFQGLTYLVQSASRDGSNQWMVTKQNGIWVFIYHPAEDEAGEDRPENRGDEAAESRDTRLREAAEELRRRRAARSGNLGASDSDTSNLQVLRRRQAARSASGSVRDSNPTNEEAPVTRIFQIGLVLERYRIDDLTGAIETAWETAGIGGNGSLRYHEPTNLLFARGTPRHLEFVDQIVAMMHNAPEPPEMRAARARLRQFLNSGADPDHPMVEEITGRIRRMEEQARPDFEERSEAEN